MILYGDSVTICIAQYYVDRCVFGGMLQCVSEDIFERFLECVSMGLNHCRPYLAVEENIFTTLLTLKASVFAELLKEQA
jgi:hypothetical protein